MVSKHFRRNDRTTACYDLPEPSTHQIVQIGDFTIMGEEWKSFFLVLPFAFANSADTDCTTSPRPQPPAQEWQGYSIAKTELASSAALAREGVRARKPVLSSFLRAQKRSFPHFPYFPCQAVTRPGTYAKSESGNHHTVLTHVFAARLSSHLQRAVGLCTLSKMSRQMPPRTWLKEEARRLMP